MLPCDDVEVLSRRIGIVVRYPSIGACLTIWIQVGWDKGCTSSRPIVRVKRSGDPEIVECGEEVGLPDVLVSV